MGGRIPVSCSRWEHDRKKLSPRRTCAKGGGTLYPPSSCTVSTYVQLEHPSSRRGVDQLSDTISCPIHFHDRFNCNTDNSTTK